MFGRTIKKFFFFFSYQINALKGAGVSEIAIVTGYKSEMLENFSRHIFYNSNWHKTNMVFSLFCARVGLIKV